MDIWRQCVCRRVASTRACRAKGNRLISGQTGGGDSPCWAICVRGTSPARRIGKLRSVSVQSGPAQASFGVGRSTRRPGPFPGRARRMKVAYVDASSLIAIEFNEVSGSAAARLLEGYKRPITSNLHQAELRTAFHCEYTKFEASLHSSIE